MKHGNLALAMILAVAAFSVCHYLVTVVANYYAKTSAHSAGILHFLIVVAYSLYVLAGLVASLIARQRLLLLGAVSGLLSAIVAVTLFRVGGDPFGIAVTLMSGFILGGMGGLIGKLAKRRARNAP